MLKPSKTTTATATTTSISTSVRLSAARLRLLVLPNGLRILDSFFAELFLLCSLSVPFLLRPPAPHHLSVLTHVVSSSSSRLALHPHFSPTSSAFNRSNRITRSIVTLRPHIFCDLQSLIASDSSLLSFRMFDREHSPSPNSCPSARDLSEPSALDLRRIALIRDIDALEIRRLPDCSSPPRTACAPYPLYSPLTHGNRDMVFPPESSSIIEPTHCILYRQFDHRV